MKHVEFKHIECENYCGYTELIGIDFENGKVTMIVGKNGVGKSTLFSIIPFTLYGMTQTGLRGDKVINRKAKRNCRTQVVFKINDDTYICERYLKYRKKGALTVTLTKNGEIYKSGNNEVVEEIERLIMPRQLFFNTVLFGQKVTTFFTDLTDAEQKNIFRKILNLEIYTEYQKVASEKIKQCDASLRKCEHDIETLKSMIEEFQKQIEQLERDKIEFYEKRDRNIEKYETDVQLLKEEIEYLDKQIKDFNSEFLNHNIKEKEKLISNISEQIKILKEKAMSFFNLIKEKKESGIKHIRDKYELAIQKEIGNIDSQKYDISESINARIKKRRASIRLVEQQISQYDVNLAQLKTHKNLLEQEIERYEKLLNSADGAVCPVCLRPMGREHNKEIIKKLEEYKEQISEINKKEKELTEKINNFKDEICVLEKEIKEFEVKKDKDINELEKQISSKKKILVDQMNEEIEQLEKTANVKLEEAKQRYIEQKEELEKKLKIEEESYDELMQQKKQLDNLIDVKNEKLNNIDKIKAVIEQLKKNEFDSSMITENTKKIKTIQRKIKSINDQIDFLSEKKKVFEFWKIGFSSSGIPSMLIDEAIPFMNKRVNEYLDMISGGRYIVSFDTLQETKSGEFRDKFNIRFYDNVTHADSRELLSGGQTKIVDIATILTLSDLQENIQGVSINIMLFDEIFDALDDDNIQNVCNVLRQLVKNKSINIISHRHIDQIDADTVLTL